MPDAKKKPYKRKTIYIEKNFQRNFILKFSLIGVCAMALASAILYLISGDTVTATYRYHHLALENTADAIIPALIGTNVAVLAAFIAVTVYVALYVSFRIGGPLFRFSQDMAVIGQGNLSKRVRLRKGDQLQKFVEDINKMTADLESRVRQVQGSVDELKRAMEEEDLDKQEIKNRINGMHQKVNTLFDKVD